MKEKKIKAKTRNVMSLKNKKIIRDFALSNKNLTHSTIVNHFSKIFECDVKRRTVGNIIKDTNLENAPISKSTKRKSSVKNLEFEKALLYWINMANERGLPLTNMISQEKALKMASSLKITDFKTTNEWLIKFKRRNNLKSYLTSGKPVELTKKTLIKKLIF